MEDRPWLYSSQETLKRILAGEEKSTAKFRGEYYEGLKGVVLDFFKKYHDPYLIEHVDPTDSINFYEHIKFIMENNFDRSNVYDEELMRKHFRIQIKTGDIYAHGTPAAKLNTYLNTYRKLCKELDKVVYWKRKVAINDNRYM